MDTILKQAIAERRQLRCFYNGGYRLIEPHVYGEGREGQGLLRAFQVSGHSNSDTPTGWKLFHTAELSDVTLTDQTFDEPRTDYNSEDAVMAVVYSHI